MYTTDNVKRFLSADTSGMRNAHRIYTSPNITPTSINDAFMQWRDQISRNNRLYRYYVGDHDIESKNYEGPRAVSNLCRYITKVVTGYLVGNPPSYECEEGDEKAAEIIDIYTKQNKSVVESNICKTMSIYGSALELVYLGDDGKPRSTVFDPSEAFVAYMSDVEEDSVFGAVVYFKKDVSDAEYYEMHLYTQTDIQKWRSMSKEGPWSPLDDPTPHGFGRVPLIEYLNDDDRIGDFESIISLQDRYNKLLSDRLDDKDAFVRSTMIIQGHVLGLAPEEVRASVSQINESRVIQLGEGGSVSYLDRIMDETGVQILQDQLKSDIHKIAMVPDLSDEQFSSNASGVAMAYKLFGTDQVVADKIARMQMGFTRRCKLYDHALYNSTNSASYTPMADIASMYINFRLNTTQDLAYMSAALTQLTGSRIISRQTARANLSIVRDPQEEGERISAEAEDDAVMMRAQFEDDYSDADNLNDDAQSF